MVWMLRYVPELDGILLSTAEASENKTKIKMNDSLDF
jgi:hypothetical protein